MTPPDMVFEIRVKVGYGRFLTFYINSWEPFDFATFQKTNGARMAQTSAPFFKNALTNNANGASAPLSLPNGATVAHWSLQGAFPADDAKPKKNIQEELIETRSILADRASVLANLDDLLAPVWAEENDIKDHILATHSRGKNGVVGLNLNRVADRRPLFDRRLAIAAIWGKTKEERRQVGFHVRSLEREIERLKKLIEIEKRKAAGHGKKSVRA